ncbi:hypothetical protein ABBQ38_014688 [Trebouxia sp. C0009 RCD-2024]
MSDAESEYVSANILPLMRLLREQLERLQHAVKTDFKPPYDSVDDFLNSLGDTFPSSEFFFDATVEQFALCIKRALLLLWTQNDYHKGKGREPTPKTQDQFAELIENFLTTELAPGMPETLQAAAADQQLAKEAAVPDGRPADTTAGPSGMEIDSTTPAVDLPQATGHSDSAQDQLLKLVFSIDAPPAHKIAMSKGIMANYHARTPAVTSFRSGSRSSPPEPFHGRADDHGQIAQSWLYGVELYFAAEVTPNPVAKAVTYLQGDARY